MPDKEFPADLKAQIELSLHTLFVVFTHHGKHVGTLEEVRGPSRMDCIIKAREFAERTARRLLCDAKSDGAVNVCEKGMEEGVFLWSSRMLPAYDDPYKPFR